MNQNIVVSQQNRRKVAFIKALCQHFHLPHPGLVTAPELPNASSAAYASPLDYYNPLVDSEALKKEPALFEYFRDHYPLRRECL